MAKDRRPLRLRDNTHPMLYEINARVLLTELARTKGAPVSLGSIPDSVIDRWAETGFDAVWLMGVWTTGEIGRQLALTGPGLQEEYRKAVPGFTAADIVSSPYAVCEYEVSPSLGGPLQLAKLRERLAERGLGLILDFVVNHTARDHAWVREHPEYYIQGTPDALKSDSSSWFTTATSKGERILAFGRDPMFPAWTDTVQINHLHVASRKALVNTLVRIADQCDGVRADMAMLVLRDVFLRQWGEGADPGGAESAKGEFWSDAIAAVRAAHPNFIFIAEAYWELEWPLQQLGFDYTYDKKLYDRMRREGAGSVRDHLRAEMAYQLHSLRFIENHDEQRCAAVFTSDPWHYASALIVSTVPGMTLIHDGQMEGRTRKVPVQLARRADEVVSEQTRRFYTSLLQCVKNADFSHGEWHMLEIRPAWHDNPTWEGFLAFTWRGTGGSTHLIVVNYSPRSGQCYVMVPLSGSEGHVLEFRDLMGEAVYVRDRAGLQTKGLYFDLPGYGFHFFSVGPPRRPT